MVPPFRHPPAHRRPAHRHRRVARHVWRAFCSHGHLRRGAGGCGAAGGAPAHVPRSLRLDKPTRGHQARTAERLRWAVRGELAGCGAQLGAQPLRLRPRTQPRSPGPIGLSARAANAKGPKPWRVAWQMPATQDGRYRHRPDRGCAIRSRRRSCSHPVRASSSDRTGRRRARNTSPSGAPVDQIKLGIAQRPARKPVLHRTRLSAGWCVTEARHVQW